MTELYSADDSAPRNEAKLTCAHGKTEGHLWPYSPGTNTEAWCPGPIDAPEGCCYRYKPCHHLSGAGPDISNHHAYCGCDICIRTDKATPAAPSEAG